MKLNKSIINYIILLFITLSLVVAIVAISYKPIYKVTLNNKTIGYINKKEDYEVAYNQIKRLNIVNNNTIITISYQPKFETYFIRKNIKVNYAKFVESLNSSDNYQSVSILPKVKVKVASDDDGFKFRRPSLGNVTSRFGSRWGRKHEGIDIKGNVGDNIYSVDDGVVIGADWSNGYGKLIKIQHAENIVTYYGHCSEILAKKGDKVKRGDIIGKIGMTGRTTGSHLHFEVRKANVPQNPLEYINK